MDETATNTAPSELADQATVILIPAFNEGQIVASVIRDIRAHCDFTILVIDDASTDNTVTEAEAAGAIVIPLSAQLGAWGATQTGLRYAQRHGFRVAVAMDADGQHPAEAIGDLMAPVLEGHADVAIGACTQRGSSLRQVAWVLMKTASGVALEDVTSGFRVYNARAIEALTCWRATLFDYQDIGVLLLLQAAGLRLVDVEVTMRERQQGSSRVFHSWLIVAFYMASTLLLGFTKRNFVRSNRAVRHVC